MKKFFLLIALLPFILLLYFYAQNMGAEKDSFRAEVVSSVDNGYVLRGLEGEFEEEEFESHETIFPSSEKYPLEKGDKVFVTAYPTPEGDIFVIHEYDRTNMMLVLLGIFIVVVLVVARWVGFNSLVSLLGSLSFILVYILPMLVAGYNPIFVSLTGGLGIMFFTIYLSHGFSRKTTIAFGGILISMVITIILSYLFTYLLHLSGYISEEVVYLVNASGFSFDIISLLIAGIIIGTIGVLDDVCISQTSLVEELHRANPKLKGWDLYSAAMRVGVDHVGSVVNTLALAYTASMLPLLLLFVIVTGGGTNYLEILNQEILVTEFARILISSIGVVSAVPITTWLAVNFDKKKLNR